MLPLDTPQPFTGDKTLLEVNIFVSLTEMRNPNHSNHFCL